MEFGVWTWSSERCHCPWQGGWDWMICKIPSNPNHTLILWSLHVRISYKLMLKKLSIVCCNYDSNIYLRVVQHIFNHFVVVVSDYWCYDAHFLQKKKKIIFFQAIYRTPGTPQKFERFHDIIFCFLTLWFSSTLYYFTLPLGQRFSWHKVSPWREKKEMRKIYMNKICWLF